VFTVYELIKAKKNFTFNFGHSVFIWDNERSYGTLMLVYIDKQKAATNPSRLFLHWVG